MEINRYVNGEKIPKEKLQHIIIKNPESVKIASDLRNEQLNNIKQKSWNEGNYTIKRIA